jgi:putative IMPACT (imprinted ancient) family translation regulator
MGYPDETRVRHWIEQAHFALVESQYTMTVRLTIQLPASAIGTARDALRDLTQGRAGFPEHV